MATTSGQDGGRPDSWTTFVGENERVSVGVVTEENDDQIESQCDPFSCRERSEDVT